MKKQLLALAALAALSGVAAAQSVTIYGVVDGGLQYTSKDGGTTAYKNGGLSPSILGFKGSEDLGGGLKANFNLEAHLSTETGATGDWGGTFGRQANVGVSGSFGAVALGKQYTPAVLAFAATDPRGLKETNSGLMTWAYSAGTSNTQIDVFAAKAVSYNTQVSGVNLGLLYGVGGVAGDATAGRQVSAGLTYAGPVTLSAAYHQAYGTTLAAGHKTSQKYSVGVGYTLGAATFKANYMSGKSYDGTTGALSADYGVYGLGVNYALNTANTLTVAYYSGDKKNTADGRVNSYIVSNDYALSKRTTVYGLVGVAEAGSTAGAGGAAIESFAANKSVTVLQLGVKHSF